LGPLVLDVIDYPLSISLHNQLIGLDAFSLVLVAPLCAAAGVLVLRGQPAGAVIALGPATYTAYMFAQYLIGPGYRSYPAVLVFHLSLFILGGTVAVRAWSGIAADELPPMGQRARRVWSWVLFGLAAFVVARYLPALVGSVDGAALTDEFRAEPAFFWTIFVMDLGVIVPCAVAAGVSLRQGAPGAIKATYALLGWFALVPPSVAAMAVTMLINEDPNQSAPASILFVLVAVACGVLAVRVYRPLFQTNRLAASHSAGPDRGCRVEQHRLAAQLPVQHDRQVDVDEPPRGRVQVPTDPVA
jgi:hypothetical protein